MRAALPVPAVSTAGTCSAPVSGTAAHAAGDDDLEDYLHVFLLNRGVLLTPFHNMALMCPVTTDGLVDLHLALLEEAVRTLLGG